jgi:hypothetical protein
MDRGLPLRVLKSHFPIIQNIPVLVVTVATPGDYPLDFNPVMIVKLAVNIDELLKKVFSP